MQGGIKSLIITAALREMKIFTSQYSLTRCEVRIHTFPATRQSTSMKNNQKAVLVCIRQDILIQLHSHLLVTSEKVNFYSTNTNALHPFHLLTSGYRIIHNTSRSLRSIIPIPIRIIPQIKSYPFVLPIFSQFFNFITPYLLIPQSIHQHGLVSHCCREINIPELLFIISTSIHTDNPAP